MKHSGTLWYKIRNLSRISEGFERQKGGGEDKHHTTATTTTSSYEVLGILCDIVLLLGKNFTKFGHFLNWPPFHYHNWSLSNSLLSLHEIWFFYFWKLSLDTSYNSLVLHKTWCEFHKHHNLTKSSEILLEWNISWLFLCRENIYIGNIQTVPVNQPNFLIWDQFTLTTVVRMEFLIA